MNRAVFLDRDNTIIHNDGDLGDPAQLRLIKGAAMAIASLRGLGYRIVVITNQGGVARGKYSPDDVDRVHKRLAEMISAQANGAKIDQFYYCPYHPEGDVEEFAREHPWRKPQPGMLLAAQKDLDLDFERCWLIGDQIRDIEAGKAVDVRSILVGEPARLKTILKDAEARPDFIAQNLIEAARIIAQQARPDPVIVHGASEAANILVSSSPTESASPSRAGVTYPAVENLGTTRSTSRPLKPSHRPFKPWMIQPPEASPASDVAPGPEKPGSEKPAAPTAPSQDEPVVEVPASPPLPDDGTHEEQPPVAPPPHAPATEAAPPSPTVQEATPQTPPPVPPAEEKPGETDSSPRTVHLLEQITRLLKARQVEYGEYSMYKMIALGLAQPLAAACAVIGLFLALGSPDGGALGNWLMGAVLMQLVVITLLILHWQR